MLKYPTAFGHPRLNRNILILNIKLLYKTKIPLSTSSNFFPTLHVIYPGLHFVEILEEEKQFVLDFFKERSTLKLLKVWKDTIRFGQHVSRRGGR